VPLNDFLKIIIFIGLIIGAHEFGHWIVAKILGLKPKFEVGKWYIGVRCEPVFDINKNYLILSSGMVGTFIVASIMLIGAGNNPIISIVFAIFFGLLLGYHDLLVMLYLNRKAKRNELNDLKEDYKVRVQFNCNGLKFIEYKDGGVRKI